MYKTTYMHQEDRKLPRCITIPNKPGGFSRDQTMMKLDREYLLEAEGVGIFSRGVAWVGR